MPKLSRRQAIVGACTAVAVAGLPVAVMSQPKLETGVWWDNGESRLLAYFWTDEVWMYFDSETGLWRKLLEVEV